MAYGAWQPGAPLASWVESIWIQESPATGEPCEPTRLLPTGRADLVVSYGDPFVEVCDDGHERTCPRFALTGVSARASTLRATGRTGLVLVQFHPWAAAYFGSAKALTGLRVDAGAVVGDGRAREVIERVATAATTAGRARVVERFLLERLPKTEPDRRVVAAVQRLRHPRGPSVATLAGELGMSRRHFARVVSGELGVAPKTFARIQRLQAALRARRDSESWGDVAATCGYSDQAHLTKECVRLTGFTPTVIDRRVGRAPLQEHFNPGGRGGSRDTVYV